MYTWAELKTQTLYRLDLPSTTTGDVAAAVEVALQNKLIDIANEFDIRELFVETSSVSLTYPDTTLSVSSDFSVTDLHRLDSVGVNPDPTVSTNEWETWDEVSWSAWLSQIGYKGDNRRNHTWSLQPDEDTVSFNPGPASGVTWGVKLRYYKTIAAFNLSSYPELPAQFQKMLAVGAALEFPQYYSGDRLQLFSKHVKEYQSDVARLERHFRTSKSLKRRSSRVRFGRSTSVNWG